MVAATAGRKRGENGMGKGAGGGGGRGGGGEGGGGGGGGGSFPPVGISLEKFLGESENTSFKKGSQKYSRRKRVFHHTSFCLGSLSLCSARSAVKHEFSNCGQSAGRFRSRHAARATPRRPCHRRAEHTQPAPPLPSSGVGSSDACDETVEISTPRSPGPHRSA